MNTFPNPTKSIISPLPLEHLAFRLNNIEMLRPHYQRTDDNMLSKQLFTFKVAYLNQSIEARLSPTHENQTELKVEVKPKRGLFKSPADHQLAQAHLHNFLAALTELHAKTKEEIYDLQKAHELALIHNKRHFYHKKRFIIPLFYLLLGLLIYLLK